MRTTAPAAGGDLGRRWLLVLGVWIAWAIWGAAEVSAHKVTIFAWVEGDRVYTQSKFSGGRKAVNAPIEVLDPDGRKLLEGRTDAQGEFSFLTPQKTDLRIILIAGAGHRNEWRVQAGEFAPTPAGRPPAEMATGTPASKGPAGPSPPASVPAAVTPPTVGLSAAAVEQIVTEALARQLRPIHRALGELQSPGPSLREILGGIGYILGLIGIGTYYHFRRQKGQ